ncbi:MAG TPA: thioredoxin, partial [Dongiaceae bacterium]
MDQLIGGAVGSSGAGANAADLIKDSDQNKFAQDVIDASMQVPVIVDFWAEWCGPCKQLGPTIEKIVKEAKGAVRLVKIDVDKNQQLAAQLRIQSIPAVYAFFQGRPVDGFVGAQPESQLRQFVQHLAKMGTDAAGPSPIDEALEQAEAAFAEGDYAAANAIFEQVLAHESDNAKAIAGVIRCSVALGQLNEAREFLA